MGATIHPFNRNQAFPERIETCLQAADWGQIEREVRSGFDPRTTAYGGLSLFESILNRAERDGFVPPLALPVSLLDALLENGQGHDLPCSKPALAACVEYGQWQWAHLLMDRGFTIQSEKFPILDILALGRAQRCEDAVMEQIRSRLATTTGNTDAERAQQRERKFSMAMLEHARVIYAKDTRSVAMLIKRLVDDFQVDANAPLQQHPASSDRPAQGARMVPTALDNAILRRDEAMAFALLACGARFDGALVVNEPSVGSIACRPVDMALSARCYEVFIHMLAADPGLKDPLPGYLHTDPASLPLADVMVSGLLPMENAAALLGDLLHASQGMWSPADLASAMQTAAKAGHVGMMKQLSAHGVAYDVRTANGFLPIHQACAGARAEAIDFLLARGASLADQSSTGVRAFDLLKDASPDLAGQYSAPPPSNVTMLRPRR